MTSHLERLATRLSATDRLKSTLSSGAALDVYVAEDWKTGARVVIKALREEKASGTSAARFLAAITSAAQLDHPHIVPLNAFGTVDGLPYYVSPVIDGVSLRTRLIAAPSLSLQEVLRIATEVGAALDFAEHHHILHCNLKPEKVMLHGGRALVADFGLEPAVGVPELPRRSMPGSVLGTPEYMSPEQAQGDTDCDGRSDVYSLACIVYEMIWGHPPFVGPSSLVLRRQLSAEPMPLCCLLAWRPARFGRGLIRVRLPRIPRTDSPQPERLPRRCAMAAIRSRRSWLSDRVTAERPIERPAFSLYNTRQSA